MSVEKQLKLFVLPGFFMAIVLVEMKWYGDYFNLLETSLWFDKVMHTIGGAGGCVLAFWGIANLPERGRRLFLQFGLPLAGRAAGVVFGFAWEVCEIEYPIITDYLPQSRLDTIDDLIFGYFGAHIAGEVYEKIWRWRLS